MKNFLSRYKWLLLCLCVHVCFFLSAAYFGWFNIFFSRDALHVGVKGIDFLQIPRGAWSVWHGGELTGVPLKNGQVYAPNEAVNPNVYHPFFTVVFGSFLMLFDPATSYTIWIWVKLVISLAGAACFYWNFRTHRYAQFATCIMLTSMSNYMELAAGQYHLLFNVFLLLLLVSIEKKQHWFICGSLYFLCLLIKPIGLLFVPVLLRRGQWRTVATGIGIFAGYTLLFYADDYYMHNLLKNIWTPNYPGPNQIINLMSLLRYQMHWPDLEYKIIQYGLLAGVLALGWLKRIPLNMAIFFMVVYWLLFYNLVYEYDWSTLAYVAAICLVTVPAFQSRWSRVCAVLICLPSCFAFLRLIHVDVSVAGSPGSLAWEWMIISKLVPLAVLCISVLWGIRPIAKHIEPIKEEQEEQEPLVVL